jgi:hypothetical protein
MRHYTDISTQRSVQKNSVTLSPQANYTDWATATGRRNLVPTFAQHSVQMSKVVTVYKNEFTPNNMYYSIVGHFTYTNHIPRRTLKWALCCNKNVHLVQMTGRYYTGVHVPEAQSILLQKA